MNAQCWAMWPVDCVHDGQACILPKLKCYNPDHVSFGTRSEEGKGGDVAVCLIVFLFPRMDFHMPLCTPRTLP